MKDAALPIQEIIRITDDLARYWRDHYLMDQLTVTRGYAELAQMDPQNVSYAGKLRLALERLAEMAGQRGLRSITERIGNMGIHIGIDEQGACDSAAREMQASSVL